MGTAPLLELRGVTKRFGAVEALRGVSLTFTEGEVTALVGDNGAGKSTVVKGIGGTHHYDSGTVEFEGELVSISSPHDATRLGIEIVYQDLALCDNLDIVQNMFLGREPRTRVRGLDEHQMERLANETLARLSVTTVSSVRQRVSGLSGGQRQSVAVAKAVMWNSKLVILDEPTAALGVAQTLQVLELVRTLRDKGLGVVIISHNLHDIFQTADRIVVMRLGQVVTTLRVNETNPTEVVELITTGELSSSDEQKEVRQ